jgi:hypothetical protein
MADVSSQGDARQRDRVFDRDFSASYEPEGPVFESPRARRGVLE